MADKPMLKQDLVAEAVNAGRDRPTAGVAYILGRHGVTMTPDAFSQGKKVMAKRAKPQEPEEPKPEETRITEPKAAKPVVAPRTTGKPSAAELARQLKTLVVEYGAHEVAAMLDVFKE